MVARLCALAVPLLSSISVLPAGVLASSSSSSCSAPGWVAHGSFDPTPSCIGKKPSSTTKTCGDCLKQAVSANHSVYAWNHASHHCYSGDCTTFGGAHNPRVQSGCHTALPGCDSPNPAPTPAPSPGPAVYVPVEGGSSTMGRACLDCVAGAVMDDPKLELKDGYLSYDEMPQRQVTLQPFSIMTQPVSVDDFTKSGLPGSVADASHDTAVAYAAWLSAQPGDYSYRLPTEAEWEATR